MSEIKAHAERAAQQWFAETKAFIESQRAETGDSFADAGQASLEAAVQKLAGIIEAEYRVDLSPATPELWNAVRDLLSLMQQDSHGMWAFNSLSRDASMFQAIIERLHAATPASHVDEERIAGIRARRAAISPTPWTHDDDVVRNFDGGITADYSIAALTDPEFKEAEADAEFIANAPTDVAYLLTAYDELRAQRDRLIHTLETRAQRETEMLEEVAACARLAKEPASADRVEGEQWTTFGRIKIDPENETETFERLTPHVCAKSGVCNICNPRPGEQPVSQEQRETKLET